MQTTLGILEAVLLILVILVALAVLATAMLALIRLLKSKRGGKRRHDSELDLVHLDKDLADRVHEVRRSLLPEKQRKKFPKEKDDKSYDSTVFVLDFNPGLRAHEVDTLRKEIDIIVQVATPKDEVVVRIDSPGGTVNGYGHAASQLLRVHGAGIPLTICVDEVAASGGYMCAAVADKIVASPFAYIGSIGVVAGMPNFVGLMKKIGIRYVELTAGENKRTLTPFSEPTPQKEAIELERLEAIHNAFKNLIKQRRPNLDIDKVADGNYWLAVDAKELGLVDIIQTSDEYLIEQSKANRRVLKVSCKREKKQISKLLDALD
ncbi:MAG TPA: protease SohB [Bryobacteraceae bacterium]|jgi:serine protease SohB|nr:protease SohB [Bryobacteraceae bacterium]